MTWGLVRASYSLPEWQSVKLTFFHPVRPTGKNKHMFIWAKNNVIIAWITMPTTKVLKRLFDSAYYSIFGIEMTKIHLYTPI